MLQPQAVTAPRWLPDLYDPANPGLAFAQNIVPNPQGYQSIPRPVVNTAAVGGVPLGAGFGRSSDNITLVTAVGAANGIYVLEADNTWSQQYSEVVSGVENWEFTQFQNFLIAVAPGQSPHVLNLDKLDHDDDGTTGYFHTLAGTPPVARSVAVIRDFVVLGNLDDHPYRVQWSGFNNSTLWTPDAVSQSGYQDLPAHGGRVQAVTPGERGLIFQEYATHRMTYVGPNQLFQFDEVERARGAFAANSVCWSGDKTFYYAADGFYALPADGPSVPIGQSRVDQWVVDNVLVRNDIPGVVDPVNRLVFWSIHERSTNVYDAILVYQWELEAWGLLRIDHTLMAAFISPGATLDSPALDEFYGGAAGDVAADLYTSTIDDPNVQTSLDSSLWSPGAYIPHLFDVDNRRAGFDGPPLPAVIETGYRLVGGADGGQHHINAVRVMLDRSGISETAGVANVTVRTKNALRSPQADRSATMPLRDNGQADIRISGRYASFRLDTTEVFRGFSGFVVHSRPSGGRAG